MTKNLRFLLHCSIFALLPLVANAAGTYYDYRGTSQRNYNSQANYGNSANPFYNYGTNYGTSVSGCANGGCGGNQYAPNNINMYGNNTGMVNANVNSGIDNSRVATNPVYDTKDSNFSLDVGFSHQFAMWDFSMKSAASLLDYNNIRWNVFDIGAKYDFNIGNNTVLRLDGGFQYGMQFGDSTMTDDDITGGGYFLQDWSVDLDGDGNADQVWAQQGHALSIGTSSEGDMMGVHVGLGLADFWRSGNLRVTPSVGYRYFKYKLDTKRNYGMSLDTVSGATNYCQSSGGETQCLPFLVFVDSANSPLLGTISGVDIDGDGIADTISYISIPSGAQYVETENTYYYYQDGVSHSYEVEWAGPYVALDMLYNMSVRDAVSARVELGLPAYTSTGDQPYRPDWQHPKSLEDTGKIGDAYHLGLNANWVHALSDSLSLTVGLTFDYYNIGKADATTYLNPDYYNTYYRDPAVATNNALITHYGTSDYTTWGSADDQVAYLSNLETIAAIDSLAAAGWQQTDTDEIESIYKSMGIRIGVQAKF